MIDPEIADAFWTVFQLSPYQGVTGEGGAYVFIPKTKSIIIRLVKYRFPTNGMWYSGSSELSGSLYHKLITIDGNDPVKILADVSAQTEDRFRRLATELFERRFR